MRTLALIILVAACGGSAPPPAAEPSSPAPAAAKATELAPLSETDKVLAASALAEQYELGKAVYTRHRCDTCHEADGRGNPKNPAVIGDAALPATAPAISKLRKGITFRTAADVVAFVHQKMPIDEQGTLSEAEAYAVVAWMLDASKIAQDRALDATSAPALMLR